MKQNDLMKIKRWPMTHNYDVGLFQVTNLNKIQK